MKPMLLILVLATGALSAGCVNVQVNHTSFDAPRVTHVAICWLKEPGNVQHRQQLIDASKSFMQIPGVMHVSAGQVLPSTRPVVDSTFDVAIVIKFRDEAALAAFAEHPMHVEAIERTLRPLVERYVVYDYREH